LKLRHTVTRLAKQICKYYELRISVQNKFYSIAKLYIKLFFVFSKIVQQFFYANKLLNPLTLCYCVLDVSILTLCHMGDLLMKLYIYHTDESIMRASEMNTEHKILQAATHPVREQLKIFQPASKCVKCI